MGVGIRTPESAEDLRSAAFFRNLAAKDIQAVISQATWVEKEKGASFFRQDEPARSFYLLVDGMVKIHQVTPGGHDVLLRIMVPYEIFGYRALLPGGSHPLSAQAVQHSRCLRWSSQAANGLFHAYPGLALNAFLIAVDNLTEFQSRCRDLATEPVERRIARTLLDLGERMGRKQEDSVVLDSGLMQKDIGELTGTTVFSVSRIFAEWRRQGILRSNRGRIVLNDVEFLRRIAATLLLATIGLAPALQSFL